MAQSTEDAEPQRRARQEYPEDRFDRVPRSGRVGAHRITARPRHTWQYLIVGLIGFALLTTIGVVVVQSIGANGNGTSATADAGAGEEQVAAVLDPAATVALLDGTAYSDLGSIVDRTITDEGWGEILFSEKIADSSVEISAVFYRDPADESAARGLAEKLGGVSTYLTEEYEELGARLIVLLGSDYAGPGVDQAQVAVVEDVPVEEAPVGGEPAEEVPAEEGAAPIG